MIELRKQLLPFQSMSMSKAKTVILLVFHGQIIFSFNNIQLFKKSPGFFSRGFFWIEYGGLIGIKLHPSNYISPAADNYHFC